MTIKSSGPLAVTEIVTEFGDTAPHNLSEFYRGGSKVPNGAAANNNIATSGAIRIGAFYGAVKEFQLAVNVNVDRYNLLSAFTTAFGAPSGAVIVRLTNNATVGSTTTSTAALTIGQFPAGSIIYVDNKGSIQGAGGAANSGAGGHAIYANYPNQTVTITNFATKTIYGGGGGGGGGGTGGTGGTGGMGYYQTTNVVGGAWNGYTTNCNTACQGTYGGGYYCYSGCVPLGYGKDNTPWGASCANCYYVSTTYTSGGGGGAGGSGGNGGVGQGYGQANTSGAGGSPGSSGAGGGTNAGTGGTGGSGGSGGAGGTWGASGNAGATGASGNTGGGGNYTGGSAGSSGAGGSAGGAAGCYLVKGAANVTLINNGTILGSLA